jgi:beta-lactamase class D
LRTFVRSLALSFAIALLTGCSTPPHAPVTDATFTPAASHAFESPADACLVLLDTQSGHTRVMNPDRAAQRFSPASTFKIPNALIGVDTGAIQGADYIITWDGTKHEREVRNHDHSLRSAIRVSVVWYFQELARRVGEQRMQAAINALDYGNKDISSGLTTFWLRGSIRISAHEQVAFLRKLHEGSLPVNPRSAAIVKDCLILAQTPSQDSGQSPTWTYRGKTGTYSGPVDGIHADLGWFVGWIEKDGRSLIFAANDQTKGTTGPDVRAKVEQALIELGELPPDWQQHEREVPLP